MNVATITRQELEDLLNAGARADILESAPIETIQAIYHRAAARHLEETPPRSWERDDWVVWAYDLETDVLERLFQVKSATVALDLAMALTTAAEANSHRNEYRVVQNGSVPAGVVPSGVVVHRKPPY